MVVPEHGELPLGTITSLTIAMAVSPGTCNDSMFRTNDAMLTAPLRTQPPLAFTPG